METPGKQTAAFIVLHSTTDYSETLEIQKYNILNSVYPQDSEEQASHFKIIQTASNFPHKENLDFWNCGSVLNVRYKQTYIL